MDDQHKTKLRDKSSGEGVTSYRITSYLTLSQTTINKRAEEKGEEVKEVNLDPLTEGFIVATDLDPPNVKTKKTKKGKLIRKGPSPVEKLKGQFNNIKEVFFNTVFYPFRVFAYYLDLIIENIALITQNMGAIMSLAYKAMVKQIKESSPFQGEEVYEPSEPDSEENAEEENAEEKPEKNNMGYENYDSHGNKKVSFLDLHELNINFTDNKNALLFHFDVRKTQTYRPSPAVIDPLATRIAIQAIIECAERAASIPPAMEGPYANIPLSTVLSNIGEDDLQAFLRYVKVYPGNYVGRNLKISETFATWIVYGAPTP